jgi:hypothetical protein
MAWPIEARRRTNGIQKDVFIMHSEGDSVREGKKREFTGGGEQG